MLNDLFKTGYKLFSSWDLGKTGQLLTDNENQFRSKSFVKQIDYRIEDAVANLHLPGKK